VIGSHARDRSWTSSWNKPCFAWWWRRSCEANSAIPSRTGGIVAYSAAAALATFEGTANQISTVGKLLVVSILIRAMSVFSSRPITMAACRLPP
jgi:hypothetical protein